MRRQRFLLGVLRLCLSSMLVLILHEFLGEGLGLGARPKLLSFLPLMACYIIGGFFPGKRHGWLLLLPVCGAAVYLQALLTGVPLSLSVNTGLVSVDAVLLFILGQSRTEAWPSALGLPAVGFCLLSCALLSWRGQSAAFPGFCAILGIIVSLLDMHQEGMEAGLHNAPGEAPMPYPRGLRWKNWLLIALFLGISLGIAAVPVLRTGADCLWGSAVSGTKVLTGGIAASLREKADQPPAETPTPAPSPSPSPTPEPEPEEDVPVEGIPPALRYGWGVTAVLLIAALLYLWRKGGKTGFSLRKLGERLKCLFRESEQDVPYVDEVEKLRPWKSLTNPVKENVITRVRKARRKRIKLSDLPDDRQRVRYVYRELIRSPAGVTLSPAMTPSEVGAAYGSEPIRDLVSEYNLVRYSPQAEVSRDAGGIAESAMKELRSAARKQTIYRSQTGGRAKDKPNKEKQEIAPSSTQDSEETSVSLAVEDMDMDTLAILPAIPVWLPLANVWENIRCAAKDTATALQAVEAVGLTKELLRKDPKSLTNEQQWLAAAARSLAARGGSWEADLSSLDSDTANRIGGLLERLSEQEGFTVTLAGCPCAAGEKRVCCSQQT